MNFFSFSPRHGSVGLKVHETLELAETYARAELEAVLGPNMRAKGPWAWRATGICYGRVLGTAVESVEREGVYSMERLEVPA